MRLRLVISALVCTLLLPWSPAAHGAEDKARAVKPAIVLASFGSTDASAQKVQARFVEAVKKRHPDIPVLTGLTARMVQKKLRSQGKNADSLYRAMADAADAGYSHVAVQSLQVIPGEEFEGVEDVARAQEGLAKGISRVEVGAPLLASSEDVAKVAAALLASLPKERKAGEPVIFVGHGTDHGIGSLAYPALAWHLSQLDGAAFASTIEGSPSMEDTLALLSRTQKGQRVWLAPLLALAGEHAANDLFGDDDDSWKSRLTAAGLDCRPHRVALLDIPAIRDLWLDHLDEALAELGVGK